MTFEDDRYQWRETYFVLFDPARKPLLQEIRRGLNPMFKSLVIRNSQADEEGRIETLSVVSYEDRAAIDLIYQCGEQVLQETEAIATEMLRITSTKKNRAKIEKAKEYSARLDVLHFEQMKTASEELDDVLKDREQKDPEFTFTSFSRAKGKPKGPFAGRPKFQFDPNKYIPPPEPSLAMVPSDEWSNETESEDDELDRDAQMDPNTLILVLELLCRLTNGIAIDPASGTVI